MDTYFQRTEKLDELEEEHQLEDPFGCYENEEDMLAALEIDQEDRTSEEVPF